MENLGTKQTVAPTPLASGDLSKAIEQSAERKPGESITAVRVYDNYYRCNWRTLAKSSDVFWLAIPTITKSRFLRATMTTDGLIIEDMSRGILPAA